LHDALLTSVNVARLFGLRTHLAQPALIGLGCGRGYRDPQPSRGTRSAEPLPAFQVRWTCKQACATGIWRLTLSSTLGRTFRGQGTA
jgi:hypothetical protein